MQEFQSIIYGGTNLGVVQQVECGIWDAVVEGSSPFIQTKQVETASLFCKYSRVDIAEVRRFESYPPDKGI